MRRRANVQLDEITLDTIFEEKGIGEKPLSRVVFRRAVFCALILGAIALGRVWILGGALGGDYRARAENALERVVVKRAPRGQILDRFGSPLVKNAPSISLYLDAAELARGGEEEGVRSALARAGMDAEEIEEVFEAAEETSDRLLVREDVRRADAVAVEGEGLRSLSTENDVKRSFDEAFAHLVGYTGLALKEEVKRGFSPSDRVGRTGIEAQFDGPLRGANGKMVLFKDAKGLTLEERILREPESGSDLATTIDGELQRYFYGRLKETMRTLGAGPGGVGIALDPRNGEVLSLVSLPSFSSENIVGALTSPRKPIFNRAVSGLYNPGSIIKAVVAVGALKEGIVAPKDKIFSAGYIELPNPYVPEKPSRFLDWKAHGWVDLRAALARSSNVYFYTVGGGYKNLKGLGMAKLKEYYELFGLGGKTGVAMPGEAVGEIPSPERRAEQGGVWRVGDTYNVSIGQGDLLVTPIALLNAIASIVNGGTLWEPKLAAASEPRMLKEYRALAPELAEVARGMRDAVAEEYGTAHALAELPIPAVGKTGSAQIMNNTKINAFFVGCAPVPWSEAKPPLCLLVLVENAKGGSLNAVPVARDVFNWYYENRLSPARE